MVSGPEGSNVEVFLERLADLEEQQALCKRLQLRRDHKAQVLDEARDSGSEDVKQLERQLDDLEERYQSALVECRRRRKVYESTPKLTARKRNNGSSQ